MERPFPYEKKFPYEFIDLEHTHIIAHKIKKAGGNHKLLEIFFRFEQKKHHIFYINFYFDPDIGEWERKELRHLSENELKDPEKELLYVSGDSKRMTKEIKEYISYFVLQNPVIRNLPLFKTKGGGDNGKK